MSYVRPFLIAVVVWSLLWIAALVALSPPGTDSFFGAFWLFFLVFFLGAGLSVLAPIAVREVEKRNWPRPLADLVIWAFVPTATLCALRMGFWDEVLAGGGAGLVAGFVFWLLSKFVSQKTN